MSPGFSGDPLLVVIFNKYFIINKNISLKKLCDVCNKQFLTLTGSLVGGQADLFGWLCSLPFVGSMVI